MEPAVRVELTTNELQNSAFISYGLSGRNICNPYVFKTLQTKLQKQLNPDLVVRAAPASHWD
jgi:hypothetical protein